MRSVYEGSCILLRVLLSYLCEKLLTRAFSGPLFTNNSQRMRASISSSKVIHILLEILLAD